MIASIRSFFRDKVELSPGDKFNLASNEETVAENDQREELTPLSKDEVKTIISHRPSPLYKAIFLTQLSGTRRVTHRLQLRCLSSKRGSALTVTAIPTTRTWRQG